MKIKVASKSKEGKYRTVFISRNVDGSLSFKCDCPANVWGRLSNGRKGKIDCRHILKVKEKYFKGRFPN